MERGELEYEKLPEDLLFLTFLGVANVHVCLHGVRRMTGQHFGMVQFAYALNSKPNGHLQHTKGTWRTGCL